MEKGFVELKNAQPTPVWHNSTDTSDIFSAIQTPPGSLIVTTNKQNTYLVNRDAFEMSKAE
jgi:hypothetical protein